MTPAPRRLTRPRPALKAPRASTAVAAPWDDAWLAAKVALAAVAAFGVAVVLAEWL